MIFIGDVVIRVNPAIAIVILADKGKVSKIIKKAPIKHNKIPNVSPAMKTVFFSPLNENRVCCF